MLSKELLAHCERKRGWETMAMIMCPLGQERLRRDAETAECIPEHAHWFDMSVSLSHDVAPLCTFMSVFGNIITLLFVVSSFYLSNMAVAQNLETEMILPWLFAARVIRMAGSLQKRRFTDINLLVISRSRYHHSILRCVGRPHTPRRGACSRYSPLRGHSD